jgi:hypothetical protein
MSSNGSIPTVLSTAVELLLSFISLLIYPHNSSCRPRLRAAAKNESEKAMRYFGVFSQVDCVVPIHNTVIRENAKNESEKAMRYFDVFSQVDCVVPIHNTVIREKVVPEASTLKVYFYCVFFCE